MRTRCDSSSAKSLLGAGPVFVLAIVLFASIARADFRITRIHLDAFDIPLRSAFITSKGSSDSCYGILVTLHAVDTESGRVVRGIGSILPRSLVSNEIRRDAWNGAQQIGPLLIGGEIRGDDLAADMETARQWVDRLSDAANAFDLTTRYPPAPDRQLRATLCGFDVAILDLIGQVYDKPICDLFDGGKGREHIQRSAPTYGADDSASRLSEKVRAAHPSYQAIRLKIGLDPAADLDRLAAVAEALRSEGRTDTLIWVDVNQAWKDAETSIRQLRAIGERLEAAGFTAGFIVEQPTAESDLPALAEVTRATRSWSDRYGFSIRTMADESIWLESDARRLVKLDAADMVNIKMQKAGGFFGAMALGRYLVEHSPETGIYLGGLVMTDVGAWANIHLSFALPRLDLQTSGAPRRNFPANIASNPITYAFDRTLSRPTHSGLSTAVDRRTLSRFIQRTAVLAPQAVSAH